MNTSPKIAKAGCMSACMIQNCATGDCKVRAGRKTCVCSRCANGSNVGVNIGIGIGKGKGRGKKGRK
ncbi:hypothetical protein RB195_007701 [Necator americanus]|nr:hypothetical protein NECAME_02746 [Necator americanus]ETN78882.1 hypothetical protein NECAME_02746 [Necator americanus]